MLAFSKPELSGLVYDDSGSITFNSLLILAAQSKQSWPPRNNDAQIWNLTTQNLYDFPQFILP